MKKMLSLCLCLSMLLSPAVDVYAEEREIGISIIATSDVHGYLMPWDYSKDEEIAAGSLSQISTAIKEYKLGNENVIIVETGDFLQGNSVELFTESPSHPAIKALNYIGYDTLTLGNHEFDFGLANMKAVISQFKGEVLAGNLYLTDGEEISKPYTIIEKDGVKIALIGMTTPMIMEFNKDNELVTQIKITDPVEETKKIIKELEGKVDALVGIMHMGQDNENNNPNTGVDDIARACPELDVIICGHMHKNVSQAEVNGVVITEPGVYAQQLSIVELSFEKGADDKLSFTGASSQTVNTRDYERDLEFEAVIAPEHQLARDDANQVIGKVTGAEMAPVDEMPGVNYGFLHSTPMTRFFNEVQLHYSGADVVSLTTDFNPKLTSDTVLKKDIAFNYTYAAGETTVYEVTGKDLKDYMEWSADYFNTLNPGDITVSFNPERRASKYSTYDIFSGVDYTIDLTKPSGDRIQDLKYSETGEPVAKSDVLTLGLNAYRMEALLAKGGIFEGRSFDIVWVSTQELGEDGGTIRAMAIDYIKNVKNGVYTATDTPNWRIAGIDERAVEYKAVSYLVNKGLLTLKASEDGRYTNLESINGSEVITRQEADAIISALGCADVYAKDMTRAEFYVKAVESENQEAPAAPEELPEIVVEEIVVEEIVVEEPVESAGGEYIAITVAKNDVLWKIARKYNTTWQQLAEINNLNNPHLIIAGQELLVPQQ